MSTGPSAYPPSSARQAQRRTAHDPEQPGEPYELGSVSSRTREQPIPSHSRHESTVSVTSTLGRDQDHIFGHSQGPNTVYSPLPRDVHVDDHHGQWDWHEQLRKEKGALKYFTHRFSGRDRWVPWLASAKNIVCSSEINWLIVFLPFAWTAHFHHWGSKTTFALCYVAMTPLAKLLHFCGEQMLYYLGHDLGELLIISLDNIIEATLAVVLLVKCDLKLLQSTITGVLLLHLLLIPGLAFLFHGARIWEQTLHPVTSQLNNTLLTVGVLAALIPTAFFSALDRGQTVPSVDGITLSDEERGHILHLSHGLSIVLLVIYVASRIYLHNPPGEGNSLILAPNAPEALKERERELVIGKPRANVWTCLIALLITVALMATTAEFLVESIEHVREDDHLSVEWFGIFVLPMVSAGADGAIALRFYVRRTLKRYFGGAPPPPEELAKGRAIDLSVQFVLFWMPVFVLLGWWLGKPLHLLFDYYELALLLGACFIVSHVTADAKTNWIEGLCMIGLYVMIVVATWYYPGQEAVRIMLRCTSLTDPKGAEEAEGGGEEDGDITEESARLLMKFAMRALKELGH